MSGSLKGFDLPPEHRKACKEDQMGLALGRQRARRWQMDIEAFLCRIPVQAPPFLPSALHPTNPNTKQLTSLDLPPTPHTSHVPGAAFIQAGSCTGRGVVVGSLPPPIQALSHSWNGQRWWTEVYVNTAASGRAPVGPNPAASFLAGICKWKHCEYQQSGKWQG